jgi:hypothetical protein
MSKLNKTKEYAIKYLSTYGKKSPEDIAKELKVSLEDVNSVLNTQETTTPAKTDKTKNLMIRQTSVKKNNSVSIMTEAASQLSDEFVKNIDYSKKTQSYIFRPKD